MYKVETSFFLENCTQRWSEIFSDNYFFILPEDSKCENLGKKYLTGK